MPALRPQSHVALALAALALTLATWWAFDTITGPGLDEDEAAEARSILPPDTDATPGEPAARPVPPRTQEPPMLQAGRPPLNPPEQVGPETVKPLPAEADPTPDAEPAFEGDPGEDEQPEPEGFHRSRANRSHLLGGVDRVNARATQELLVEGSFAWIGSPAGWVRGLANQRAGVGYVALPMEAPRHRIEIPERFWIDRYEVTNHRYWEFLRDTASVLYRTSNHPPRSIVQVTETIIVDPPANLDLVEVTGRQLFHSNSAAILQAFKSMLVMNADGESVDLDKTYDAVKDRVLPNSIDLRFYERAPPGTWRDSIYGPQRGSFPVRDIAVEDAIAFSLYRGRHVPTEQHWEYVARGATGLDWPWGADGSLFDANVNGGHARKADEFPRTVEVFHHAEGRSPAGAVQMTGNVSEWTSSFLDAYPGGARTLPGSPERQVVVRGGSAFDQDRYLMRPAFRGWLASDPDGAPTTSQRRAWTGFRTARFERPGQSRLPTMHFRARKGRRLDAAALEPVIYAGFEGLHTERFEVLVGEDESRRRLKPRPGRKAFVVQPFQIVCTSQRGRWRPNVDEGLTDVGQLHAQPAPVLYGLVHTDLHILDTWHSAEEPFNVFNPPVRLRREDVPPGTYFVATIQGLVALLKPDFTDVWYVGNRPATKATLNVLEQRYGASARRPRIENFQRRGRDRVDFEFFVPMHASAEPGRAARLVMRLVLDVRETRSLLGVETGEVSR